jgi:hypothetical protein
MCAEEELAMVIADSHLIDVIAAVIEVGYCPAHKSKSSEGAVSKARSLLLDLAGEYVKLLFTLRNILLCRISL